MFRLSNFFSTVERDGQFKQTQFANTSMQNSLCYVAREQYLYQVNDNPNISCVVAPARMLNQIDDRIGVVASEDPEREFYQLHNQLYTDERMAPEMPFGINPDVDIHASAVISPKSYIGEGVRIGAGVVVEDYSYLSDGVCVDSGAIIGSSGHYFKQYDGKLFKVEHAGGVWLEQGVQVLSAAVISKALHPDFTRVGKDSVVSIKAHIAHGCDVGERCTITGNVQVSGFTTIGDDVWIGPSATIGNLLRIGNGVRIDIGSVVIKDVPDGSRVSGNFAYDHRKHVRDYTKVSR